VISDQLQSLFKLKFDHSRL